MSRIETTGRYTPEQVVTNESFSSLPALFSSVEDFFTGYDRRRHAHKDETGVSMAVKAAKDALSNSRYNPEDIDLIIGGIFPSSNLYGDDTNLVQDAIKAHNAAVLPINTACSTFVSALNVADSLIRTDKKKCVLVIIAVNWVNHSLDTEGSNFAFAGDGAAAVILEKDASFPSLLDVYDVNNSKPAVFESMVMKSPVFTGKKEYFTITEPEGISTAKDLVLLPVNVARELLRRNPETTVDKVFIHQSGLKMMQLWTDKMGMPFDKVRHTLPLYANMTAANIPVSLDYWIKKGDIQRGETLLFFAPAAGGHYIAMLWRY